jgi:DNA-binding NarL/FixJ family response regulator
VAAATRAQVAAHLASGTGRDSPALWSRAVDLWAEVGYPDPEAWCRLRYAEALLSGRSFQEAERELRAVVDLGSRLGCGLLSEEASTLARRARLTVKPTGSRADVDAILTAREQEVLTLVALGKTNSEIAADLFMSPKTASVHISRILHKLGATNRTEAAWHAHQLGLD